MDGTVKVNGRDRSKDPRENFSRLSCYIMQDDALRPALTVLEAMTLVAHLRLGYLTSYNQKKKQVRRSEWERTLTVHRSKVSTAQRADFVGQYTRRIGRAVSRYPQVKSGQPPFSTAMSSNTPLVHVMTDIWGSSEHEVLSCSLAEVCWRFIVRALVMEASVIYETSTNFYKAAKPRGEPQWKLQILIRFL